MIKELRDGLSYVGEGFALARQPGLRPYLVVPLIMNFLLFGVSGYLVMSYAYEWIAGWGAAVDLWSWLDWLEPVIDQLLGALKWVIFAVIILGLLFIMGSTFTMFTHLLVSPFIGILGEKAELALHEPSYPQHTLGQIALRTITRECRKMLYWIVRAAGLALISVILYFIPVVNAAVPVLWFLFGSWILAMQYIDVAADNNGIPFKDLLMLMQKHRTSVMAFGAVIMALTSIPIVNLFIIPVAVCGGIVFWVKKIQPALGTVALRTK
ncbi:sulfate transporter CysZ [Ketobacter sp. MCCC 1A13808]|uniref:sulfate transporter CysZ n=1 Tax=Ketobacter sp. MCCC 1A13808 TaxID=2602738 RepID=UPI000F2BB517|nr:sulfate transporter CysZ [Ketobacter sp. MCCC 1A13808]MVF10876.1 sulfate transporter CysZ [Ketobacter sp. MCCC 1A13808]RLP56273.1 MAG: sulfate transporter CysZ [Ketobacter sp.]